MRTVGRAALAAGVAAMMSGGVPIPAQAASADNGTIYDKKCHGSRRAIMTVGGAVLGGVIGNILGNKGSSAKDGGDGRTEDNRVKTTAIGAGLGGLGGNLLGKAWDEDECKKAQAAMALALSTGTTQTWTSQDGQRSLSYMIDRRYNRSVNSDVPVVEGREVDLSGMMPSSGVYLVTKQANVRARPNAAKATPIYENFKPGKRLAAMGRNGAGDWTLVSSGGGVADGWVSTGYLSKTTEDQAAFLAANANNRQVKVTTVAIAQPCMDTHQQVTDASLKKNKTQVSGSSTVCRDGASGNWVAA